MPSAIRACAHDFRAVCYLCSDKVHWWADARGGGDPPNQHPLEARELARVGTTWVTCPECGGPKKTAQSKVCNKCHGRHLWKTTLA